MKSPSCCWFRNPANQLRYIWNSFKTGRILHATFAGAAFLPIKSLPRIPGRYPPFFEDATNTPGNSDRDLFGFWNVYITSTPDQRLSRSPPTIRNQPKFKQTNKPLNLHISPCLFDKFIDCNFIQVNFPEPFCNGKLSSPIPSCKLAQLIFFLRTCWATKPAYECRLMSPAYLGGKGLKKEKRGRRQDEDFRCWAKTNSCEMLWAIKDEIRVSRYKPRPIP